METDLEKIWKLERENRSLWKQIWKRFEIWKRTDLEKGGGYFERLRKVQTTLTRIFIVLESVSHFFSENQDGIPRKPRKFKHFFRPNSGDLQKKKVFTEIGTDFSAEIGNSNV